MLVDEMSCNGTNIMRNTSPLSFDKKDDKILVKYKTGENISEQLYDTVLLATGKLMLFVVLLNLYIYL